MDHRYFQDGTNQNEPPRPQRNRSYQDAQGGYWISDSSQQYEDPQLAGPTVIDPQLQYEASLPTILPPGTSFASYGGYRQAGYQGYGSSSSSHPPRQYYDHGQQHQQPIGGEVYGHDTYEYREQDAPGPSVAPQSPEQGADEGQSIDLDPGSKKTPNPKNYLCAVEGCNKGKFGCGFTTLNDLERHGRSKHGEDGQYIECRHEKCPDRWKRFPRRDNFVDHFCRVHGDGSTKELMKAYALEKAKEWMVVKQAGNWSKR
ncbi:hypothetical protein TWF481_011650 [Arthrobotrys musiformis]|uniref:C2H2-type domain-containing protein n=1 Tax=Arthrobotrys musiformis TaxID=47236 RepID=A0AAV9W0B7_9PEZI